MMQECLIPQNFVYFAITLQKITLPTGKVIRKNLYGKKFQSTCKINTAYLVQKMRMTHAITKDIQTARLSGRSTGNKRMKTAKKSKNKMRSIARQYYGFHYRAMMDFLHKKWKRSMVFWLR